MSADERLTEIERRLSRIESALKLSPTVNVAVPQAPSAPAARPAYVPPAKPVQAEARPGNWLGALAVICFVLAAAFIIKLSIDSGWLTPARQVGIAATLGIGLVAAGLALMERDREYASLLPGAGVIVLYLTTLAAHVYYGLISFEVAIAVTGTISALCIWLYTQVNHDVYPITAALGSYLAPALLGLNNDAVFSLYYFVLCSVAFATISIWLQSRTLTMIAAYLAILLTASVGGNINRPELVTSLLAVQFFVFALGTYAYTQRVGKPLTEQEAWSFFPVLLIFYAVEYHQIEMIHPGLAPWISLGFTGILIGLYLAARKNFTGQELGSGPAILAFATVVGFHSIYLELLPEHIRPWLFPLILLGVTFAPPALASGQNTRAMRIPRLALMAILALEYMSIMSHLLQKLDNYWLLLTAASFASLWASILLANNSVLSRDRFGTILLGSAHALAVVALYRLTTDVGSLAVSASWLLYALAVVAFAFVRKDEMMAKSALLVLSFAAGKALLYDAASAPTIVRILCLLLTGAVLYGCGFLMRAIAVWKK